MKSQSIKLNCVDNKRSTDYDSLYGGGECLEVSFVAVLGDLYGGAGIEIFECWTMWWTCDPISTWTIAFRRSDCLSTKIFWVWEFSYLTSCKTAAKQVANWY